MFVCHQIGDIVRRPSERARELCYSTLIFIWLIMFPMVSNKIFRTLDGCEEMEEEGRSYMKVDLRIDCDSGCVSEWDVV